MNITIPPATPTKAGVMAAQDKEALDEYNKVLVRLRQTEDAFYLLGIGDETSDSGMRNVIGESDVNTDIIFPCIIYNVSGNGHTYGEVRFSLDKGPINDSMIDMILYVSYISQDMDSSCNAKFYRYVFIVSDQGAGYNVPLIIDSTEINSIPVSEHLCLKDMPFSVVPAGTTIYTDESHTTANRFYLPGMVYKLAISSNVSSMKSMFKYITFMNSSASENSLTFAPGSTLVLTNTSTKTVTIAKNTKVFTTSNVLNTSVSYIARIEMSVDSTWNAARFAITNATVSSTTSTTASVYFPNLEIPNIPANGYLSMTFYPMQ